MSKNKVMLAIASLENDESLMRFDKVSAAVAMLKEAHLEVPSEVKTGPVPIVTDAMKSEVESIRNDFNTVVSNVEERIDSLHVKLLQAEKVLNG